MSGPRSGVLLVLVSAVLGCGSRGIIRASLPDGGPMPDGASNVANEDAPVVFRVTNSDSDVTAVIDVSLWDRLPDGSTRGISHDCLPDSMCAGERCDSLDTASAWGFLDLGPGQSVELTWSGSSYAGFDSTKGPLDPAGGNCDSRTPVPAGRHVVWVQYAWLTPGTEPIDFSRLCLEFVAPSAGPVEVTLPGLVAAPPPGC